MVYADHCESYSSGAYVLLRLSRYSRSLLRNGALQPHPYSNQLLVLSLQFTIDYWTFPRRDTR